MFRNERASINHFTNPIPVGKGVGGERGTKGDSTTRVEDVTTNKLIGPRVSGQAGGRKVAPSRVETDRVGSAGTDRL